MKSRLLVAALAVAGFHIIDGKTANASECSGAIVKSTRSADWSAEVGTAGANDTVIIQRGHTVTITSSPDTICALVLEPYAVVIWSAAATLEISGADNLWIKDGAKLMLGAGEGLATKLSLTGGGEYVIDGELALDDGGDFFGTLRFGADSSVSGSGVIRGTQGSGQIDIDGTTTGKILTNRMVIEGALIITRDGAQEPIFVNDGQVYANRPSGSFKILFDNVEVRGQGEFKAGPQSPNDELEFDGDVTATGLHADFSIIDALLDINSGLTTSGHLHLEGDSGVITCNGGQCIFAGR